MVCLLVKDGIAVEYLRPVLDNREELVISLTRILHNLDK